MLDPVDPVEMMSELQRAPVLRRRHRLLQKHPLLLLLLWASTSVIVIVPPRLVLVAAGARHVDLLVLVVLAVNRPRDLVRRGARVVRLVDAREKLAR